MEKYIVGITNNKTYLFYFKDKENIESTIFEEKCTLVKYNNLETAINSLKKRIKTLEAWNSDNKWKVFNYNYSKEHIFNIKYLRHNIYNEKIYSINISIPKIRKQKLKKLNESNL